MSWTTHGRETSELSKLKWFFQQGEVLDFLIQRRATRGGGTEHRPGDRTI